jgi:hypothetical protein
MKKGQLFREFLKGKNFQFGSKEVFNSQLFYEGKGMTVKYIHS